MLYLKKTNQILHKLVSENCLSFGRNPKLSNRKITHYLSGTRQQIDIFNLYEMRYLLLKVYPLIHNLFLQQRLNERKKKKVIFEKKLAFPTISQKLPKQLQNWENFLNFKTKFNKPLRRTVRPIFPKILFATTTEMYSSILCSAAANCHMPFHVNRWLSGTITASASYLEDFEKWSFLTNDFHKDLNTAIYENFWKRKKNMDQQAKHLRKYQLGRKPSLIIIPDVSNNEMIIKETKTFGIPVLGMVSSNCNNEIAYPIFANDLSIYSIYFFCHFLSSLIAKEILKTKHKLYIATKKTIHTQFPQALQEIFRFNSRVSKLKSKKKKHKGNPYVFKGRYFLDGWVKPKIKIKKTLKYQKKNHFQNKPKKSLISPKKLIVIENQKRFVQKKNSYFLKKRILPKIKLLKQLHHFSFPKIWQEIRFPANKPRFRFWNQNKFFFSNSLHFVKNTSLAFQFQRFVFPKLLRKSVWNTKKKTKRGNWHKKQNNFGRFRKRWPIEKLKNSKKHLWMLKKK